MKANAREQFFNPDDLKNYVKHDLPVVIGYNPAQKEFVGTQQVDSAIVQERRLGHLLDLSAATVKVAGELDLSLLNSEQAEQVQVVIQEGKDLLDMFSSSSQSSSSQRKSKSQRRKATTALTGLTGSGQGSRGTPQVPPSVPCSPGQEDLSSTSAPAKKTRDEHHICSLCGKDFQRSQRLRDHKLKFHQGEKFECTYCKKELGNRGSLTEHIKTQHQQEYKYKCNYQGCPWKGSNKPSALDSHLINVHHQGEKRQCNQCGKKVSSVDSLTKHLKGCTGGFTAHVCPQCGLQEKSLADMLRHCQAMKHKVPASAQKGKQFQFSECVYRRR
jgi:hypothetical protein